MASVKELSDLLDSIDSLRGQVAEMYVDALKESEGTGYPRYFEWATPRGETLNYRVETPGAHPTLLMVGGWSLSGDFFALSELADHPEVTEVDSLERFA